VDVEAHQVAQAVRHEQRAHVRSLHILHGACEDANLFQAAQNYAL